MPSLHTLAAVIAGLTLPWSSGTVEGHVNVVSNRSELAELWAEAANWSKWRQDITRLRDVLAPPIPPQEEAMFEI